MRGVSSSHWTNFRHKGKYFGKMPPRGWNKFDLLKKQGRNWAEHGKEKPEIFPVFERFGVFFPVFESIHDHFSQYDDRIFKNFGASRQGKQDKFGHFSPPGNREKISIFPSKGGGKIRVFGQNIYPCFVIQLTSLFEICKLLRGNFFQISRKVRVLIITRHYGFLWR